MKSRGRFLDKKKTKKGDDAHYTPTAVALWKGLTPREDDLTASLSVGFGGVGGVGWVSVGLAWMEWFGCVGLGWIGLGRVGWIGSLGVGGVR